MSSSHKGSYTLPRKRSTLTLLTPNPVHQSPVSPVASPNRYRGTSTNPHGSAGSQQHKRAQSVSNENYQSFPPLKNDLLADLA